jgi:hypothetical protein
MGYQLYLHIDISRADAIEAGASQAGRHHLLMTEERFADLRVAGLVDAAKPYIDGSERGGTAPCLAVRGLEWPHALAALRRDAAEREALEAAIVEARAARDAKLLAELAGPEEVVKVFVGLTADGAIVADTYARLVEARTTITVPPLCSDSATYASVRGQTVRIIPGDQVITRRHAAMAEREARIAAARERLLPGLRAELARLIAEREATRAREQAERAALYARLPKAMRDRDADGFAGQAEIQHALADLINADAGYGGYDGYERSEELSVLTDEEHSALLAARRTAPVGATVTPLEVYDLERTPCDEHEEYERDCPDCPMERDHVRRVARITWTRGGVDVRAYLMLGPGWGKTEAAHAFAQRREAAAKILGDEELE